MVDMFQRNVSPRSGAYLGEVRIYTLVAHGKPYGHHRCPPLGDLLTNAKKVTVSVLYWYGKLSSLLTEIFKMILKRINFFYQFF